jgi:hypothetical protein
VTLPAEFRLVAACCIWPPSERRNAAIRAAAGDAIDWENLLRIVTRQRVGGLVHDGLDRAGIAVPENARTVLARGAAAIVRQALAFAHEALQLQNAFDAAGIPVTFVKGTALAVLAYGNLGIKQAWDIDMLVLPEDVRRVCGMLDGLGYVRTMPPASMAEDRFFAFTEFARESLFHHRARGVFLELHWRLSDNRAQLAHVDARAGNRLVAIGPRHALRTLNDDDLFAYLCLHGAHHAWSRLKWLADVAALLGAKDLAEIERLYRKAQQDGVGRAAAQALLLCEQLFGTALPAGLSSEMRRDRAVRWLVSVALAEMAGDARQTDDHALGNLRIEVSHFLLADGPRSWLRELQGKAIGWTDFQNIALPRRLYFLYPALRLPSWLWRRVSHLLGHRRQLVG